MFEERTYETIMQEMMNGVDPELDTREGSIMHDVTSPTALENAQMYVDLDMLLDETFADTASFYYLLKRAAERGIQLKTGNRAVIEVETKPQDLSIEIGTEFNIGRLNYSISEKLENGHYALICDDVGTEGNNLTDTIIPMQNVDGLESITAVSIKSYGTEDESEESLRNRYFDSFSEVAFGGNKAEYKEKAEDFSDVSACKVYPVWNGGGTVKLVILGTDYKAASEKVVQEIQEAFDPTRDGAGVGIAPIGHIVTVETVTNLTVNISFSIVYQSGWNWEDVKETLTARLNDYMTSLRETWEDQDELIVRVGQIESIIIGTDGIKDVSNIKLNSTASNLTVDAGKVPILGTVTNG